MQEKPININTEVTAFLDELKHPFREEIELLRLIILTANDNLFEKIKWNGPNYSFENEDRITMSIQPPKKQVLLILHRGAKKQEKAQHKLISNISKLFVWKENDRAVITFKSMLEIENSKIEIQGIINEWIIAVK
jgi:hypothetical protein